MEYVELDIHQTPEQNVDNGMKFGRYIRGRAERDGWDKACSDIIANSIVCRLTEMTVEFNTTMDELLKDRKKLCRLLNSAYRMRFLFAATREICVPDLDAISRGCATRDINEFLKEMRACLSVFSMWCIYRGADSDSVRRLLRTKDMKSLSMYERHHGPTYFVTQLENALCIYFSLYDRCFKPTYQKMLEGQDAVSVNSMADAFSCLRRF